MRPVRNAIAAGLVVVGSLVVALMVCGISKSQAQDAIDFAISESYLHSLADGSSIIVSVPVRFTHRTNDVHSLSEDCEMHLAGKPIDQTLGAPNSIVVEPPNLCKFHSETGMSWPDVFDSQVMHRDCVATGFPRIFTEHAKNAGGGANPNHVFELHPATKIVCGDNAVSFEGYLTVFPHMRAITPSSADNCVRTRSLSVRYNSDKARYEFLQDGGQHCGNFAVAEVGFVEPAWVHKIGGGHSAIARVSLNGESRTTLKIYTLEGSEADSWLAQVKDSGMGDQRTYLHGMLTYDYFSIVRAVRTRDGTWLKPTDWMPVKFPLAFVVFGMPNEAPWSED